MQCLYKLTGFEENLFEPNDVINEANRKFAKTYLIINNKLRYIDSFTDSYILLRDGNSYEYDDIISIKPWMPKPGIYMSNNLLFYLYRLPKRQWLKSFAYGENYNAIPLHKDCYLDFLDINQVFKYSKSILPAHGIYKDRQWAIYKNQLVFKYHVVGKLEEGSWENKIVVTDPTFYQEVHDTWKTEFSINLL